VLGRAVERVGRRRAHRAAGLVLRPEHEVVDDELRAAVEKLGQRPRPGLGVEAVLLVDRHPRQLAALARELVVAASELLLADEQLVACALPFLAGADFVRSHYSIIRAWTAMR
jgi:hypothetical protein